MTIENRFLMKQLHLITALFISISAIAQSGTTLDEYRYLSKGYVYQIEMGLDAQKEGYSVKNLFQASNGAELVGLYKKGNSTPRALLVIINKTEDKFTYVCVPNNAADKRVKDLAKKDRTLIHPQQQQNYYEALVEFLFQSLSDPGHSDMVVFSNSKNPIRTKPAIYQNDETLVSRSANVDQYLDSKSTSKEEKTQQIKGGNMKASTKTVYGELAGRTIEQAEEAYARSSKRGVVAIKICVDKEGNIKSAKFTQRGSTTFDSYLKKIALEAAKSIKFAANDIPEQCGIVNYKF